MKNLSICVAVSLLWACNLKDEDDNNRLNNVNNMNNSNNTSNNVNNVNNVNNSNNANNSNNSNNNSNNTNNSNNNSNNNTMGETATPITLEDPRFLGDRVTGFGLRAINGESFFTIAAADLSAVVAKFDVTSDSIVETGEFTVVDQRDIGEVGIGFENGLVPTALAVAINCGGYFVGDADGMLNFGGNVCNAVETVIGASMSGGFNPFTGTVEFPTTGVWMLWDSNVGTNARIAALNTIDGASNMFFWNQPALDMTEIRGTFGPAFTAVAANGTAWVINPTNGNSARLDVNNPIGPDDFDLEYLGNTQYLLADRLGQGIRVRVVDPSAAVVQNVDTIMTTFDPSHVRIATFERGFMITWKEETEWRYQMYRLVVGGDIDYILDGGIEITQIGEPLFVDSASIVTPEGLTIAIASVFEGTLYMDAVTIN